MCQYGSSGGNHVAVNVAVYPDYCFVCCMFTAKHCYFEEVVSQNLCNTLYAVGSPTVVNTMLLHCTGCCTVAEVRKRGDEFWSEFEFYLSDVLVGIVLDVVLVTLMAPRAMLGGRVTPSSSGERLHQGM